MKTVDEIYQEMLEVFAQRSGYLPNDACDLSVRLYAMAAQVQALYAQADWVARQAFPQTAEGLYLDYHGETRGLVRSAATPAEGKLRFYVNEAVEQDLEIPSGTVCMTAGGIRYATTEAAVLSAGTLQVDVSAQAAEPGSGGNMGAGLIVSMAVPPAGIARCSNPEAFTGGMDEESDESLRERILDSYRRLPNGANAAFYEQEAMAFPGVVAAAAVGRARGVGTVDIYIATAAGVPDEELVEEIEDYLQEKREIAVDLQVLAPQTQQVNITLSLTAAEGYEAAQAAAEAEAALEAYFTGRLLGKGVTLAALGDVIYHLDSVANYAFTAPAADVAAEVGKLPVLGTAQIGGA